MVYIIVEGEKDKSAYRFWSEINKHICKGQAEVIGVPGSGNLYYELFEELVDRCKLTDKLRVLLVFDKASGVKVYNMMKNIDMTINELREKGMDIKVVYTPEFSFEEWVLISNEELLIGKDKYREIIKKYNSINKNWAKTIEYKEYVEEYSKHWVNRENAASRILSRITTRKEAQITKRKIGDCWTGNELGECKNKKCTLECKNRIYDACDNDIIDIDNFISALEAFIEN